MKLGELLFVSSTYLLIALFIAILTVYIMRIKVVGKFWMAFLVSVIGAVLGGVLFEIANPVIQYLTNLNNQVNIFPPLFFSCLFVWFLVKLSKRDS